MEKMKVYGYRWVILFVFALINAIVQVHWLNSLRSDRTRFTPDFSTLAHRFQRRTEERRNWSKKIEEKLFRDLIFSVSKTSMVAPDFV